MKVRNSSRGMPHRGGRADDVRLDEVQAPARRPRGQEADVVLAEDLAAEEREHEAELLVADRAVQPARHRAARRCPGPPAARASSCSIRSKRTRKVARFRSTHSRRSTTAGISSASGSCEPISSATIGSILSRVVAVEGLRLRALAGGHRSRGRPEPAMGDLADRLPIDERRPGAAHDLARRDAGAEGEQPADDDPRAETGGVVCHGPQSTGTGATGSISTDSTCGSRSPKRRRATPTKASTDPVVATRWPRRRPPPAPASRARRAGPRWRGPW